MKNEYPEIKAKNTKATKLMVMLHGLGSDGHDLISLVPFMQEALPDYYFISPDGVEEYDMAPFGRQWFSIQDRTPSIIIELASQTLPKLESMIKLKQQELGVENEDTVILGFSQGAMMGINLTLSQKDPFKAMIAFSGRLIPPVILNNRKTPICIIHGKDDEIIEFDESKKLAEYCKNNHIMHESLIIPNLMHSIDNQGLKFAIDFLKKLDRDEDKIC